MSVLKTVVRYIDDVCHSYFGRVKILFLVRNAYGLQGQLPILQEIVRRGHFDVAVAAEFDGCIDWKAWPALYQEIEPFLMDVKKASGKKWHYVIATDLPYIWFQRNATWIFMPHGAVFGVLDRNQSVGEPQDPYLLSILEAKEFSVYFCVSEASYDYFRQLSPQACDDEQRQFFVTGYPPIDELQNSSREQGLQFLRDLNLPIERKTIVIGSHWTEKSLLMSLGYEVILALCVAFAETHNIILMGHPRLWRQGAGIATNPKLRQQLCDLHKVAENFRFVPGLKSTTGLLRSADIFVGDNSSFMTYFCIADKPIVFFDHPDFEFANSDVGKRYRAASEHFFTLEELVSAIKIVGGESDPHRQARADLVDLFVTRKGQSAEYCADVLEKMGRVCGPNSPGWKRVMRISNQDMAVNEWS